MVVGRNLLGKHIDISNFDKIDFSIWRMIFIKSLGIGFGKSLVFAKQGPLALTDLKTKRREPQNEKCIRG